MFHWFINTKNGSKFPSLDNNDNKNMVADSKYIYLCFSLPDQNGRNCDRSYCQINAESGITLTDHQNPKKIDTFVNHSIIFMTHFNTVIF